MANNSPTIVAASLSDDQLKKSIDSLVSHVDEAMKKMVQSTNNAVGEMEAKLKSLGNLKIDSGGSADGGSSRRTSAVEKETKARKELNMTLDQQAAALEKASGKKRGIEYTMIPSDIDKSLTYLVNTNKDVDAQMSAIIQKEQSLIDAKQREAQITEQIASAQRAANSVRGVSAYDLGIDPNVSAGRQRQISSTRAATKETEYLKQQVASLLEVEEREIKTANTASSSYAQLAQYLKNLQSAYQRLGADRIAKGEGTDLANEIQRTQRAMQKLQQTMSRPISLKDAMGLSEKTLDDIAYKMRQLASYRSGLNVDTQKKEIQQVNDEYNRLKKRMDEVMQKNQQMIASNTALGRSWNYMKNRLAFYFSVGASTAFVKNLIEVRSQYEMNERALGILIDSAERGTQIFNELSSMALVSPYTLIELSTAAKQLTAYDVAAKDVVDTTRRLADMAAAVGIPIERLTYALGQIKAYGYLNSRDARMFANAGIPLVKQLSEYYTELEGRLVSTADVYDRIKKKAIDYGDVMQVINKMTDEGGKFYDFQAKMADTLKVQLANLTLAWNNMLNEIGESSQGILSTGIGAMKELFMHWQQLSKIMYSAAGAIGMYIAYQIICNKLFGKGTVAAIKHAAAIDKNNPVLYKAALSTKKLSADQARLLLALNKNNTGLKRCIVSTGILTEEQATAAMSSKAFGTSILFLKNATSLAASSIQKLITSLVAMAPELLPFVAIGAIIELFQTLSDRASALSAVNETIAKNAKESADSIKETLSTLADSGITAESATKLSANEQKKAWGEIRNAIEMTAAASNVFIESLLKENSADRISKGIGILEDIKNIHEIMALWHDDTIDVTEDFKVLGIGADGLSEDLKDFVNAMNKAGDGAERLQEISSGIEGDFRAILSWIYDIESILPRSIPAPLTTLASITGIDFLDPTLNKTVDAYIEVNDEIEKLSSSLMNQLLKDNVENVAQIQEVQQKAINSIAQEKGWSEQQTMNARMLLEQKFAESSIEIFRESVADRNTAWNEWMKYLTAHHKTEFTKMGEEEISVEKWSQDRRKKLYENTFEEFKKYNVLAAEQIKDSVNDLSKLQVHIKVFYDEQNQPSWLEKDFKNRLPNSTLNVKEYKSVTDLISGEQKALKDANEEIKRLRNAGVSELDEHFLDVKNRARQATEALDAYNAEHEKETKGKSGGGSKKDPLLDALKQEISLVEKLQGDYDKLTKSGASQADALAVIRSAYGKTINLLNAKLGGAGLPTIEIDKLITGKDPNKALAHFKQTLDMLVSKGLLTFERSKELEAVVEKLTLSAKTYNLDKITKGLNNELGKLKDEYELAVELDANPELGDMFADMFGINTSTLPKTFGDALDRAQIIINRKLAEMNITTPFDLMEGNVDSFAKSTGLSKESEVIKELVSVQNTWRDMFKKNITETEKMLDDYIKKYGDYSDKIAEIEAGRLEKLKRLNEAYYTEEMRKRPEYMAKLNAIEQGASKEKQQVNFDEFKNSRYYTMMFENLDYISTKTIRDMRDRVRELMDTMNDLTPEQLKTLVSQYEKLEQKLVKRNPFKTLAKDLKAYFKESKNRKDANVEFRNAQKEYDAQKKNVAALKEKYEQAKANTNTSKSYLDFLQIEINAQSDILDIFKKQLELAEKKANKYNLTAKLAKSEALQVAQVVATNLKGIAELRDQMNELFGVDASKGETLLGHKLDGVIDGLSRVSDGISRVTSSAQSGNVFGVVGGVVDTFVGIGDSIASIFGGGSARTKRLNKEINESKETVRQLSMAYEDLERAINKSLGTGETEARRLAIANKEAQLAELERQKELEQSKRSKDRDDDAIKQYEEAIHSLRNEIEDLKEDVINNLWGEDVKSAAEAFVDAWVEAWKAGETTIDAIKDKMDEMIYHLVKKAMTSKIVESLLKPLYSELDRMTKESSEGGVALTVGELRQLAQQAGLTAEQINTALGEFYGSLSDILPVATGEKQLSSLQQGIQGITEDTAGALEAITNGISQQCYLQSDLLTQIRDAVVGFDMDVQTATMGEILLQLRSSYEVQMAIHGILEGVLTPSGRSFSVELVS